MSDIDVDYEKVNPEFDPLVDHHVYPKDNLGTDLDFHGILDLALECAKAL